MRVRGIPQDKTSTLARFGIGAGGAVQGLVRGLGAFQELEHRERELALREQEAKRREALLEQSMGRTALAFERHRAQQERLGRKEDREARERSAAQRAQGSVLDAMKARLRGQYGAGSGAASAGQGAADWLGMPDGAGPGATTTGALPPEIDQAFDALANDPDLSPEDRAEAAGMLADVGAAGAKEAASRDLLQRIQADVASGFWTPDGGLGIALNKDLDGDGQTDEWSAVPQKMLDLLAAGKDDPGALAAIYDNVKREGTRQRAVVERRAAKLQEAQQMVAAQAAIMPPEAEYAVADVLSRFGRGEFGDDEFGEREFQREFGLAMNGLVSVPGKSGIKYAVPYDQAAAAELDLNGPPKDPTLRLVEDFSSLADRVYPKFEAPSSATDEEIAAARGRYLDDKLAFLDKFLARFGIQNPAAKAQAAQADDLMKGVPRGRTYQPLPGPPSKAAGGGARPAESTSASAGPGASTAEALPEDPVLQAVPPQIRAKYDSLPQAEQAKFLDALRKRYGGG